MEVIMEGKLGLPSCGRVPEELTEATGEVQLWPQWKFQHIRDASTMR